MQIKKYKAEIAKLKDRYEGLGGNADRIMTIENELLDLERQKTHLRDVMASQNKYIKES